MSVEKVLAELENQGKIFHEFKKANDERVEKLEKGQAGVGEIEQKLERMNAALDKAEETIQNLEKHVAKNNRPGFAEGKVTDEHKKAFKLFLTNGDATQLKAIRNTVRTDSDTDGGLAVPDELDRQVESLFEDSGAMMNLCLVKTAGKGYQKLFNVKGTNVVNTSEMEIIENTSTSKLVKITPVWGKKEAKPLLSQEAIEDIFFDAEAFVKEDVFEELEESFELELLQGTGASGATKGLLLYDKSTDVDGTRAFGSIQYLKTGVSGGFKTPTASVSPADDLIDVQSALKEKFQKNATWLMNRKTKGAVRKFKDANGAYIWQPRLDLDTPEMILGDRVATSHGMPIVAANSYSIIYGDFKKATTIVLRPGLYVVRDPYSKKPNVEFIFVKRYGFMLRNSEGLKILQNAA
ncbi:MAG: phage major capsid protein [Candidatus Riflebacteria bacterium]|nr:phage major capsid protein [Candidatus Riflebacteria bacterium]